MEGVKLTENQKNFLEGYFEDILFADFNFEGMSEEEFVERVSAMDFDDGSPALPGIVRVAKNLNAMGLFDDFDPHDSVLGQHIYLSFSERGARLMFELMTEAKEAGRLNLPASQLRA